MAFDIDLLRSFTQTPGIASREHQIRNVVAAQLGPFVDTLRVDRLGNLIGTRQGSGGPTIAIAAHLDEIGFIVRHIDDSGFVRLQQVGGFDPRTLVSQRARIHTRAGDSFPGVLQPASKPIHLQKSGEARELKLDDLFIDLGLPVDRVRDHISIGDMVTLDRDLELIGNTVVSKSLDDRLGLYILVQALRDIASTSATVIAIATTQEEVGLRGARTSAFENDVDIAIALDVTIAGDIPGNTPESYVTKLGHGTAIKVYDSSQLPTLAINDHLRALAIDREIPHQFEVLPAGGTDAGAFQLSRAGAFTSTISIPTRYVHTVNEMASLSDIQASIDLLVAFIEDAGTREYGYSIDPTIVTRSSNSAL
jgi:putative aminopeptidase FrvX